MLESGPRTDQANGLLECDLLIGLRRGQVRDLLGPPNSPRSGPPESRAERLAEWNYFVGAGLADPLVLAIRFNRAGRVKFVTTY